MIGSPLRSIVITRPVGSGLSGNPMIKLDAKEALTIEFTGRIPSKKNSKILTKGGHIVPSKAYRKWHNAELPTLENTGYVPAPFAIDYQFWIGGVTIPAAFDLSNAVESINDLLVDAQIIADDDWLRLVDLHPTVAGFIRGESKTIVTIAPITVPWYDAVLTLKGDIKSEAHRRGMTQKALIDECWRLIT